MSGVVPRPAVRRAGLVDVPAIARLIAEQGFASLRVPPGLVEQGRMVLRLAFAHHALEDGMVWVAESGSSGLVGVASWQTPEAIPDPAEIEELLNREVGDHERLTDIARPDSQALDALMPAEPHGRLSLVSVQESGVEGVEVALVETAMGDLEPRAVTVVAMSQSEDDGSALRRLGFLGLRRVRLPSGGSVWLSELPPSVPQAG